MVVVSTGFRTGAATGAAPLCEGALEEDRLRTYKSPPTPATAMISAAAAISTIGGFFLGSIRSSQAGIITPGGEDGVNAATGAAALGTGFVSGCATGSGSGTGARGATTGAAF